MDHLPTYLALLPIVIVGRAAQPSILDKRFRNVILEFNFFILHHAISNNLWTKVMSSNNWAFLLSHTILLPSVFCWRWCGCGCLAISLIIWLYKDGVVSSQTQMLVYCFYFCAIWYLHLSHHLDITGIIRTCTHMLHLLFVSSLHSLFPHNKQGGCLDFVVTLISFEAPIDLAYLMFFRV